MSPRKRNAPPLPDHAARRRAVLRQAARQRKTSALLVTNPQDVGYLTGFTGEDSYLLLGNRWAVLVTDGRYTEQAARECPDVDIHTRTGKMTAALADCLAGRNVRSLGLQAGHVTLALRDALGKTLGKRSLHGLGNLTGPLRQCKDEAEIRILQKAIRIAQKAFRDLTGRAVAGFVGRTERQLAAELDYLMRQHGAEAPSFETIVAAGPNSSLPHYRPAGRKIKPGEPVLFDFGARCDGYCSDLTRVVFTGTIPTKIGEMYDVVRAAQQAAIAAIRPGVACKTVDAAAREVIADAGYAEQFIHSTGHGIGLDIHEAPALSRLVEDRLKTGMVVTVEPGIYLPGIGGVRIEDDVLVTTDGQKKLSSLPTDLDAMRLQGR